jgi:hypothetical protein
MISLHFLSFAAGFGVCVLCTLFVRWLANTEDKDDEV